MKQYADILHHVGKEGFPLGEDTVAAFGIELDYHAPDFPIPVITPVDFYAVREQAKQFKDSKNLFYYFDGVQLNLRMTCDATNVEDVAGTIVFAACAMHYKAKELGHEPGRLLVSFGAVEAKLCQMDFVSAMIGREVITDHEPVQYQWIDDELELVEYNPMPEYRV